MFEIGDEVIDWRIGNGVVIDIYDGGVYSVVVKFNNEETECYTYTKDGKLVLNDTNRSLYHKGTEFIIKPAEPKRSKWVNLFLMEGGLIKIGVTYTTKKEATIPIADGARGYIKTIEITPEEMG